MLSNQIIAEVNHVFYPKCYPRPKKIYVCLRSPDPPYFPAADPNLFNRQLFHPNFC